MKKILLAVVLLFLLLGITGSFKREKVTTDELNIINNKIIDYFQTNVKK